jgi:uncharacterized membrane protein
MKKYIRNSLLLIVPFIMMVAVNEIVRPTIKEKPCCPFGTTAINSAEKLKDKCTWACSNQINYCKTHHVRFNKNLFIITNPLFYGVGEWLQATGSYILANIIFLVVLIPLVIWFFLIKSLNIQDKINQIKKNK